MGIALDSSNIRVLFVGDIVGAPGRDAAKALVPRLRREYRLDFVVANCENAAGGYGVTLPLIRDLLGAGIDVLTSGNHIWDKKEVFNFIDEVPGLLRPANYPPGAPGRGWIVLPCRNDALRVAVVNLSGRVFIDGMDCPFRAWEGIWKQAGDEADVILVDFHGEATSEKNAFGLFVDGKASVVAGTHTHVQTADERILPGGTGYITDLGMTGPTLSVLGMAFAPALRRLTTALPTRLAVAAGPTALQGLIAEVDPTDGKTKGLLRIAQNISA